MQSHARSSLGFSLIELMVTVAILGALTAIGIPSYQRFASRARQSEAKSMLMAIYLGETTFYAEWKYYFADWRDIGFCPTGDTHYIVGFAHGFDPLPANIGYSGPSYSGPPNHGPIGAIVANNNNATVCGVTCPCRTTEFAYVAELHPVWTITTVRNSDPKAFTAGAAGQIGGDPTDLDAWIIDQNKSLINIDDGT